jgi:hypothetical protein
MIQEDQSKTYQFLVEYLDYLDRFVANNTLRLYQFVIISGLPLPPLAVDGIVYNFIGSKVSSGLNCLYYKETSDPGVNDLRCRCLCIQSSLVSTAYSLQKGELQWCVTDEVEQLLVISTQAKNHTVILHTGHLNSAHFLWNQLGACLELRRLLPNALSVFQEADTILCLSKVPGFNLVSKVEADQSHSLYAGGLVVTDEARGLVLSCIQPNSPVVGMPSGRHRILLTIRGGRTRSLINEVDFYHELINRVQQRFDCCFALAGFVRQHNYTEMQSWPIADEDECSKSISQIAKLFPSIKFEILHDIGIDEFVEVCSSLSYYISYEGTMHHRINWLYPHIPSTLISFSGAPPSCVARWHQFNSGRPSAIHYLEQSAYSLDQSFSDQPSRNLRASMVDVCSSSENILQEILRCLAE